MQMQQATRLRMQRLPNMPGLWMDANAIAAEQRPFQSLLGASAATMKKRRIDELHGLEEANRCLAPADTHSLESLAITESLRTK